jgi:hypothetical protein
MDGPTHEAQQPDNCARDAGVVEYWLNPRSLTFCIRGCTYCPGAPVGETIWEIPDYCHGFANVAERSRV